MLLSPDRLEAFRLRLRSGLIAILIAVGGMSIAVYGGWRLGQEAPNPDRLFAPGSAAFRTLTTDAAMATLIKEHEKLRLEAYRGAGGHWLIGYGHKATAEEGRTISEVEAEALFEADLREIETRLKRRIQRPIRRREFSALADLAYNVGPTAVNNSSVMAKFNAGDRAGAADAILLWNKITVKGEKVANRNLTLRRQRARAHFLGEDWRAAPPPTLGPDDALATQ